MLKVVIAGRPNTGKSTLFNALTRSRDALVHNRPGVTRDVLSGIAKYEDLEFEVMDTAGLEVKGTEIEKQSTEFALNAIRIADIILFVVDGRIGITSEDLEWAKRIRKEASNKNQTLLLVNKTESIKRTNDLHEFYKLGFGQPIPISAEHKQGFDKIYEFIKQHKPENQNKNTLSTDTKLRITIMGQPNVGKSTFVNKILGQKRVIVRDEPGVTRDTIEIKAKYLNREIIINDTADYRKSNIVDGLETLSALKSLDALKKTDIVILIVDSIGDIEKQTLGIAARVYDAGKILAIALNKWDLIEPEEQKNKLLKLKHQFKNSFYQIIRPIILPISAENGTGVHNLMKRLFELYDKSENRAPTSLLNRIVEKLIEARQPPLSRLKRPMKIKFVSQISTKPIKIAIHVGGASDIPESYTRYLRKGIAKAMNWEQLPIFIEYKKSDNPFN